MTAAASPRVRSVSVPSSGRFSRRWSKAASSSRKHRRAHRSLPAAFMPATSVGPPAAGPCTVRSANRPGPQVRVTYFQQIVPASGSSVRSSCTSGMPASPRGRSDRLASSWARAATASSNLLLGATSSTRPHSLARRPRTPSAMVQKTSARSGRTLRLATTLVRPPVPGKTASNGTSGRLTALLPSSMSRISSHASASS